MDPKDKKYEINIPAGGEGTEDDPYISETLIVDEEGNIIEEYTTVEVDGKEIDLEVEFDEEDDKD